MKICEQKKTSFAIVCADKSLKTFLFLIYMCIIYITYNNHLIYDYRKMKKQIKKLKVN